jgi:hypothetical protein
MYHSGHTRPTAGERTASVIGGATVSGAKDEQIADIRHTGGTSPMLVDGGGFPGTCSMRVLVGAQVILMRDEK